MGNPIGEKEIVSIKSFISLGYKYHFWSYENYNNLPKDVKKHNANEIVKFDVFEKYKCKKEISKHIYQTFSNYFRYKLLYETGDWWCDLDLICLRHLPNKNYVFTSISDLITRPELLHVKNLKIGGNIANGFFKVPAKSEILKNIIDEINGEAIEGNFPDGFGSWGTVVFTKNVYKLKLENYEIPLIGNNFTDRIKIYESSEYEIPKWAYAIHLYNYNNKYKLINEKSIYKKLIYKYNKKWLV